ncbi:NADPH-dependent FMN reductase [Bilophila wadsworthia]|uniref:NADPH-dependent FMN reductase n=1 Tax=Bilophila wadsworthia TaxID=35833 RepID=UPI003AB6863D
MNPTLNILGISGSLRAQSRNTGLLRFAKQCLPPTVNFQIAELADVPFYNADRCDSKPEPVQMLIRQVTEADALVLACPEYNYSIAPALKNALDWVSREPDCAPFNGKPVAIMGAGGGMGTSRAQYHLRQVCVYLNLRPVNKPEVFSNAFSASFNESGDLIDPSLQQQVTALMNALLAWNSQLTK